MAQQQAEDVVENVERNPGLEENHTEVSMDVALASGVPLPPNELESDHRSRFSTSRLKHGFKRTLRRKNKNIRENRQPTPAETIDRELRDPSVAASREENGPIPQLEAGVGPSNSRELEHPVEPIASQLSEVKSNEVNPAASQSKDIKLEEAKPTSFPLKDVKPHEFRPTASQLRDVEPKETNIDDELNQRKRAEREECSSIFAEWLWPAVKSEFHRQEKPRFITRLEPSDDPTSPRAQIIEVHLSIHSGLQSDDLQGSLMQRKYSRRRRGFDIRVIKDLVEGPRFNGPLEAYSAMPSDSRTPVKISLVSGSVTLCGSLIETGNSAHSSGYVPTCTFGGLVSVQDRIYGLTVAHPYNRALPSPRKDASGVGRGSGQSLTDDEDDYGFDGTSLNSLARELKYIHRQHLGFIEAWALSDSTTIPDNSDWMLIDVENTMMLPNLGHRRLGILYQESQAQVVARGWDYCYLMTYHGHVQGRFVRDWEYLTLGDSNFRATVVEVYEELLPGDSGSWVIRTTNDNPIGVVIATSIDEALRRLVYVVEMSEVLRTISQVTDLADVRLLTKTENRILMRKHRITRKGESEHIWYDYVADIIHRYDMDIGTFAPTVLIDSDLTTPNSVLQVLLTLGKVFPTDLKATLDLRRYPRLPYLLYRARRLSAAAISLTNQLLQFENGLNFLALIRILASRTGREHAQEVVTRLLEWTNIPDSLFPSGLLIRDLIAIQTIRSRDEIRPNGSACGGYRMGITSTHLADFLANIHYASIHNCFFVSRFQEREDRLFLSNILFSTSRPSPLLWDTQIGQPRSLSSQWLTKEFPRILFVVKDPLSEPGPEQTAFPGKLVRCPALYGDLCGRGGPKYKPVAKSGIAGIGVLRSLGMHHQSRGWANDPALRGQTRFTERSADVDRTPFVSTGEGALSTAHSGQDYSHVQIGPGSNVQIGAVYNHHYNIDAKADDTLNVSKRALSAGR